MTTYGKPRGRRIPTWGGIQYLLPEDECRHPPGSWRSFPGGRRRCIICGRIEVEL